MRQDHTKEQKQLVVNKICLKQTNSYSIHDPRHVLELVSE
jgi:hypothetical protein